MKKVILVMLSVLAFSSCVKDWFEKRGETVDYIGDVPHDMIVLGEQLEDPYSLENVQAALKSLYPTGTGRESLSPTDYYVRFLPTDDTQFELLCSLGLVLIDHPLDYRIVREGDYYHDPSVPEEDITWQYGLVPYDFVFPDGIAYEKLDDCYLAENDPDSKACGIDWAAVERESYRLTGNESMLSPSCKGGGYSTPSGRITITDPDCSAEPIGVKGVKVVCNSFVKVGVGFTDGNGSYTVDRSFSTDVRYRIVFKNSKGFGIGFNLLLVPASTSSLGKNGPSGVSVEVNSGSERKLFSRCVVNNAAWDYWENCEGSGESMKTPPGNLRIWLFQKMNKSSAVMLQQGVLVDNTLIGEFLGVYSILLKIFLPDVTLGLDGCDDYANIYALTQHELSHASHFAVVGKDWWMKLETYILKSFVSSGGILYGSGSDDDRGWCEVAEMWAYYHQTVLFQKRYTRSSYVFGTNYWFSPQLMLYLDDRGMNRFKIFKALDKEVATREQLQDKLLNLYPEFKSTINQAFSRY